MEFGSEKVEITIETLSDEILLEIFSWLNFESLREASLVCKKWDKIIGSSVSTMTKFQLRLDSRKLENLNIETTNIRRKHCNVQILSPKIGEILKIIEHFDISCTKLFSIDRSTFIGRSELLIILRKMPLLERLILPVRIRIDDEPKAQAVELCNLKYIEIAMENFSNILPVITTNKLLQFECTRMEDSSDEDVNEFVEFLERSTKLKSLKINANLLYKTFALKQQTQFKLELSSLGIRFYFISLHYTFDQGFCANFNNFLISQASSLTSLNFLKLYFPEPILLTIFNRLRLLSSLGLDASSLPTKQKFYEKIKPLSLLKKVFLSGSFSCHEAAKGFFGNCPNIEHFCYHKTMGDEINYLAEYNQKLTKLSVPSLVSSLHKDLRFNNLKTFSVYSIPVASVWMSLIERSPLIENLVVKHVPPKAISRETIDALLQQKSLRNLIFWVGYNDGKMIFDKLKINYGTLKSLEISNSIQVFKNGKAVSKSAKFNFPEDPTLWDIEEQEKKFEDAFLLK